MDKRKRNIIFIGILVLVLSVISFTYAIWSAFFEQKDPNLLATSCFQLSFKEDENFDMITLQKAHPITEEEGLQLNPYKFTITNNCQDYAAYEIHLEIDEDSNLSDFNAVHVSLDQESFILGSKQVVTTTLENATTAYSLTKGYLNKGESKDFELRMWIDEEADASIAGQQFLSQVTLTASYLEEEKVPPTVDLELALCENTITATGTATPGGNKNIEKYEFKLDTNDWTSNKLISTKEFNVQEAGKHTVSMKVTDNKGITSEVTKTIDTTPKTINIYGRDIPITTCNNGLYEVEHEDLTNDKNKILAENLDDWKKAEWRYAGENPNNYVWFNCGTNENSENTCEKWRIIGLVNVLVSQTNETNKVEQRVKIIRADSIGNYNWNTTSENDWTQASLMTYLNSGEYYTTNLQSKAKEMIDTDIIWNLGGWDTTNVTTVEMYGYERGANVYETNPITWPKDGDNETKARIGLMYPSDYGYSVGGKYRDTCIKETSMRDLNCTNWLRPSSSSSSEYEWLLTPDSGTTNGAFSMSWWSGSIYSHSINASSRVVRPALYLTSNVKIVDNSNDGSYDKPYELELTE